MGVVRGRIPGGVAILWHKKLDSAIKVIRLDTDWCIAVQLTIGNKGIIILNIYTPFESHQNEDEYLNRLAFINSFISECLVTSVYIVGDMNADLSDRNSMFAKHLLQFCADNSLFLSSKLLLPADSYSYISEAWHTTSWLDHCISTADAHDTLQTMELRYEATVSDHFPFIMSLETDSLPEMSQEGNRASNAKIQWAKLTKEEVLLYYGRTDLLLSNVHLPMGAIMCADVNCHDVFHCYELGKLYDSIVGALCEAGIPLLAHPSKTRNIKPGWNKYVAAHHAEAKEAYRSWVLAGRPRQGEELEYKKLTNARYKYAVRYICKHEQTMRADSVAEKLLGDDVTGFWKEVKTLNRARASLPCTIEDTSGAANIAELWRQHYNALFNCINSSHFNVGTIVNDDVVSVTARDVYQAISQLSDGKACGMDHVSAEHLKLASPKAAVLFAMCFTGFMSHGYLPASMLSVTLVPVIKDKAGKVGSIDNYRPIALASVISKVLEIVLLEHLSPYIFTSDNQFGFKRKHSTDFCIYALKEAVEAYKRQNSSVLAGFIDASKAFDRVNHYKLFYKLSQRGVPGSLIRILAYWYANQSMQVKWGNRVPTPFCVGNGVRQGGLLSPALFNFYMDDLSVRLGKCKTGCMIGNVLINHLMYADDLAIFSPSSAGFQDLLNICSEYGVEYDVKYNAKKSVVLVCRTKEDRDLSFPVFLLSGHALTVCEKTKYLGHVINDQMSDDDDMYRQRRLLYIQANMLVRKFHACSDNVKITLFRAYCTPLYTAPLWVKFKKASFHKLQVAYNDCLRILLIKPRWSSPSDLFCKAGVPTFQAVLRNLMYKFICRLNLSQNAIIKLLTHPGLSSVRYQSHMWKFWYDCLL